MSAADADRRVVFGPARRRARGLLARLFPLVSSDGRLFLSIAFILGIALVASYLTIREAEHRLLKSAATSTAVHWAQFLQARLL